MAKRGRKTLPELREKEEGLLTRVGSIDMKYGPIKKQIILVASIIKRLIVFYQTDPGKQKLVIYVKRVDE